jgi:probable HAF family extracellular repeat protein
MTGLGDLPGSLFWSEAYGVSGDGNVIVGYGTNSDGNLEAFRWTVGGMVPLGFLPGGMYSGAKGANTDGSIVVGNSYGTSAFGTFSQAFRWTSSGGMEGLGRLPGSTSAEAQATNSDGRIVVGYSTISGDPRAFIWDRPSGIRSLAEVLDAQGAAPPPGWILGEVLDVSDDGRIVAGYGINPDGDAEAFKAVVDDLGTVLTIASTAGISQAVSTPDTDFDFAFDYRFQTTTGTLTVNLDGTPLTSLTAPGVVNDAFATETILIDGSLLSLTDVTLEFILEGPTGSSLVIDNIMFPDLPNGSFLLGLNDWQSVGNVGTVVIPESATLGLLLLGGLVMLRRKRST